MLRNFDDKEKSHLKLNLGLLVEANTTEKIKEKGNAYHELVSPIIFADMYDTVCLTVSDYSLSLKRYIKNDNVNVDISIFCNDFADSEILLKNPANNLCVRTIFSFFQEIKFNISKNKEIFFSIVLRKKIPVAAGLGGGSSNAAAVLRMLTKYVKDVHNIDVPYSTLLQCANILGADVGCCLKQEICCVHGTGKCKDDILPWSNQPIFEKYIAQYCFLLIMPSVHLSTADVFKHFDANIKIQNKTHTDRLYAKEKSLFWPPPQTQNGFDSWLRFSLCNSLEASAIALSIDSKFFLEKLQKHPQCLAVRLCGSGPSLFGLFCQDVDKNDVISFLNREKNSIFRYWWVKVLENCKI